MGCKQSGEVQKVQVSQYADHEFEDEPDAYEDPTD